MHFLAGASQKGPMSSNWETLSLETSIYCLQYYILIILACLRLIILYDTLSAICPVATALNFYKLQSAEQQLRYSTLLYSLLLYSTVHDKEHVQYRKVHTQYNLNVARFPTKLYYLAPCDTII